MSSGREEAKAAVLASIRKSLGRGPLGAASAAELRARLDEPKANLIPARSRLPHAGQVDLFVAMAEEVQATVRRVPSPREVPGAVAAFLAQHNLTSELVMAKDAELDGYPWAERATLKIRRGRAEDSDLISVTTAFVGIAETGTLMLLSSAESPTTLCLLPESHIVILPAERIVGAYEEAWAKLRALSARSDGTFMPRSVNFVTGPSRTADIEQKIQLGAHGPRRLHIILVEKGEA